MRLSTTRRVLVSCVASMATLALALGIAGCGGSPSNESVVVPEPGAKPPIAGTSAPTPAAAPTAGAAAEPAADNAAKPAAPAATGWGTLKGQVVFGGAAPPQEIMVEQGKAPKNPELCAKDAPIKSERLVVDGATKGVKNVLVYLTKVDPASVNPDAKAAAGKAEVVFDQKNCIFEPHVLAVMAGTKIVLKSSDPVNHNVNARLKVNAAFNPLLGANQEIAYTPASSERRPAQVTCDIHNWMLAYWMILDHPYFAVTDAKGNFEIKNVPAGTQKVVVWQEAVEFVTPSQGEDVAITANQAVSKSFTIDPGKVKK
jgi:plastocyanin